MKKVIFSSLLVVFGLTLIGCSSSDKAQPEKGKNKGELAKEQIFRYTEVQEMPTADLSLSTDVVSSVMLQNCYEGLYRVGEKNKIEPAGATELAKVSDDGRVYTLQLRKVAKWTNGDPVTAHDYVYSWRRTVDPETKSEYTNLFSAIQNASAITAGEKDKSELGIKAISDYELEITLEKAVPYFDYLLAFVNFYPLNQKVVETYGKEYASTSEKAVYNGPFKFAEFDGPGTDVNWAYVKNDQYWDKNKVKMKRIEVNVVKEAPTSLGLFQNGQSDDVTLTGALAQQKRKSKEYHVEMNGGPYYLEMNQIEENSPFRNENLRKALFYAVDRKSLANKIVSDGSLPAEGLTPKGMVFNEAGEDFADATKNYVKYEPEKAKEYWEKAKKELGIKSLEFEILSSDTDVSKKIVEYLQSTIQESLKGVKVTASPVPFSVRLDRSNKGDFEVVLSGWNADYPDPSSFLELFIDGNPYNRGHYHNSEYNQLVEAAATTDVLDPEARWQDMVEAEDLIMKEAGVVPLYQKAEGHMRNPNIKGVVHRPTGSRYDYSKMYRIE